MPAIAFTTANFVARETGWAMHGWRHGDGAAQEHYRELETYGERLDEMLAKVGALGFDTIDLWGAHLGTGWATDEHLAIARETLERHGLRVATYATWVDPANVERACELARGIGTNVIGAGFSGEPEALAPVLARARRSPGRREPSGEDTARGAREDRARAAARSGRPSTRAGGERRATTRPRAIDELGGHVLHVHLKDVRAVGEPHDTCPWGDGVVDIEACVRTLQGLGYTGALAIEHEPEDHDPSDEIVGLRSRLEAWLA